MTLSQAALLDALRQATVGEYDVLAELGRGGMATVFVAHDLALDRRVAIKVMSPHLIEGPDTVERFKREARTAASLSHPHIIPIHAVRESQQLVFFVMKLIEGRSLDAIIRELGPLPIALARAILQQVGTALGYAHRRGVVHRDVKPANIMIDPDGWAVVTDFGIAKVAQKPGLTMTGATLGTPSYMSPEQCAAHEVAGASDQYSFGVVAYEMLTARLPFTADSVVALMYQHFNQPPPPLSDARPDCPPELAAAVMRMLQKEPADRFPDMDAAVAAIGGGPLSRDDPARTKLITVAASGPQADLLRTLRTPASPAPATRSRTATGGHPPAATVTAGPALERRRRGRRLALTAAGLAALAAALVWVGPWRARLLSDADPNPDAAAGGRESAHPAPSAPPPETAVRTPIPTLPPKPRPDSLGAGTAAAPPESATAPPVVERDRAARRAPLPSDSVLRILRAQTKAGRDRARAAGATAAELAAGDAEARQAEVLTTRGELAQALPHLVRARILWAAAERHARERRAGRAGRAPPP